MEALVTPYMDDALVLLVFMEIPVSKVCKSSQLCSVQGPVLDLWLTFINVMTVLTSYQLTKAILILVRVITSS